MPEPIAIAGRKIEALDAKAEIVALLRRVADRVESGSLSADRVLVVTGDFTAVSDVGFSAFRVGRVTDVLPLIDIGRASLLHEMGLTHE